MRGNKEPRMPTPRKNDLVAVPRMSSHILLAVPVLAGETIWPCLCWPVKLFGVPVLADETIWLEHSWPAVLAIVYFGFDEIICVWGFHSGVPVWEGRKNAGQVSCTLQKGLQLGYAGHIFRPRWRCS